MSLQDRRRFLLVACLFEGGLAVVALAVGWLAGVDPLGSFAWTSRALLVGAAAAVPMFLLFAFSFQDPFLGLRRVREVLLKILGAPLAACRWPHLLLLAVLAGVGEELLFRGLLQPWIERGTNYATGLIVSNVIFGLAHAVTLTYAIAAGVIGLFLGWLMDATGSRNVLVPMTTHALYDFLAFLVVAATYRNLSVRHKVDEEGREIHRERPHDEPEEVDGEAATRVRIAAPEPRIADANPTDEPIDRAG